MVYRKTYKGFLIIIVTVLTYTPFCEAEIDHRNERAKGGLFGSSWGFTPSKRCKYSICDLIIKCVRFLPKLTSRNSYHEFLR